MAQSRKRKYDRAILKANADEYFAEKSNRPFSMLEVCEFIGVDYPTLNKWDTSGDKVFGALARSIKARVATCWEKGEISPTLATFLMKTYMGYQEQQDGEGFELIVRVVNDES